MSNDNETEKQHDDLQNFDLDYGQNTDPATIEKETTEEKPINIEKEAVTQFANPFSTLFNKKIDVAFGMDISNGSIELLEFSSLFSHKPRVYSRVVLEDGIVEDGVIKSKEKLKEKIKILLQDAKPTKVSTNRVILALPEPQLFSWSTTVDKSVSPRNLKKIIYEESKKFIPLDYKKIYWDGVIYQSNNKENYNVTFFAIEKKVLNDYVIVCNELGLDVVQFSLTATNVARVFLPLDKEITSAVVEIGSDHTNISVFKGNRLLKLFVSSLAGGKNVNEGIVKNLQITNLEAEEMKKKFGLAESGRPEYIQSVKSSMDKIFMEVKQAFDFYEKEENETIDKVFLTGGATILKGIDEYANDYFKKEIHSLNNIPLISNSKIFDEEINLQLYSGAIGLAIAGVAKERKLFSFIDQLEVPPFKMRFTKILKTGNFSKKRMIFDFTHIVYTILALIIIGVIVAASLIARSIDWGLVFSK